MISSLIVLKIQANPNQKCLSEAFLMIFTAANWYPHDRKRAEHLKCTLANFLAEILVTAIANYVRSTMPKNWIDSLILSSRKSFHKLGQF